MSSLTSPQSVSSAGASPDENAYVDQDGRPLKPGCRVDSRWGRAVVLGKAGGSPKQVRERAHSG